MCVFLGIWYAHLIFVSRGKKYKNQVANDVLGKTSELSQSSLSLRSAVTILPGAEIRSGQSSPVVRRLGVCLPVQRMRVSSLVQEDPAGCGTTKPVSTTTGAWVPEFTHCSREQPLFSPTRESLCTATEIQRSRKYISLKKKKEN